MGYSLKKCKECGELFKPNSSKQSYCKKDHYRPCPICSKPVIVKSFNDPPRCCSKECSTKLRQQTCLEQYGTIDAGNSEIAKAKRRATNLAKYGVDNPAKVKEIMDKQRATMLDRYGVANIGSLQSNKDKVKQTWANKSDAETHDIVSRRESTCIEVYGVPNPRQSEEIKARTKQTLLDKYGVNCSLLIPEVKQKAEHSMLTRYGVLNPGESEEIRRKASQTCIVRYGVPSYTMTSEFKEKFRATMQTRYSCDNPMQVKEFQDKARATNEDRYGVPAAFLTKESIDKARQTMLNNNTTRISKCNRLFSNMLTSAGIYNELEFYLEGRWYDIVLPESKTLIEIDPTYTHSVQPNIYGQGLEVDYHKMKSKIADQNGYRCIHVFDWDDLSKIVGLVSPKTRKYFGRDVSCKLITAEDCNRFLDIYHIQGKVKGQEICIGLIDSGELLSVMSFGRPRYNHNVQWELYRYASQFDVSVIGGASKMFKLFISCVNPQSIVSYCDLSKFTGQLYNVLGFKLKHVSSPTQIWSKDNKYITNNLLISRGYDQLFRTNYGKGTNNEELMLANGWRNIYDCGQATYIYVKPEDFR